ncbi:MAG: stalk domain-containing protein [Candidatus Ornithomonoglobus sp.]
MKTLRIFFAALIMIFAGMHAYAETGEQQITAVYENIKIYINGSEIVPTDVDGKYTEPFISEGTTYLPLRAIADMLGIDVRWDDDTSSVYLDSEVNKHENSVSRIDSTPHRETVTIYYRNIHIFIDGNITVLTTQQGDAIEPFIYDGTTYLPVRAVAQLLGLTVDWNDEEKAIYLISEENEDNILVFDADFSGDILADTQFYTWEDRSYAGRLYDKFYNIKCYNNQLHLTMKYDMNIAAWLTQMVSTAGLFETDDFTCEFKAMFPKVPYAWSGVITYGTGTYWTNGLYSDGIKWPAGGEIDAFEQAAAKTEEPYYFTTPTVHYGPGTESGYPGGDNVLSGVRGDFNPEIFHIYKFSLKNGVVKSYIDGKLVGETDCSDCIVDNNYLCNYNPFKKAQAFYLSTGAASDNLEYTYETIIDYFRVYQSQNTECEKLEIYPQMWEPGTDLVFPVGSELYLDRVYIPSDTSNKACTWQSSNPDVATVCQGYVKTHKEGTAVITANCGNASAEYTITVSDFDKKIPCAKVAVKSDSVILAENGSYSLTSYVYPKFTTDVIEYASSDETIAVCDDGVIKGLSSGECNIIVSCGSQNVTIPVQVAKNGEAYIEYDFKGILDDAFETYSSDRNIIVKNKGIAGSTYDLRGTRSSTDRNEDRTKSDILLNSNSVNLITEENTAVNLQNQSVDVVYKGIIINDNMKSYLVSCTINNLNNAYPRFDPYLNNTVRYELVYYWTDARAFFDKSDRFNVVYHYDNGKCDIYANGKKIVENEDSNPAELQSLQFKNVSYTDSYGYNIEGYDMYLGCSFTDKDLQEMSTYN